MAKSIQDILNDQTEYVDSEGRPWDSYVNYVFGQFGYHRYDDDTAEKVLELLKELYFGNMLIDDQDDPNDRSNRRYFIRKSEGYEWAFQAFVLEMLSSHNLTNYGTSPRGSWLESNGKALLKPLFE